MQQDRQFEYKSQGDSSDIQKPIHTVPSSKLMSSLPLSSQMNNSIPQIYSYSQGEYINDIFK